jgi:integrase
MNNEVTQLSIKDLLDKFLFIKSTYVDPTTLDRYKQTFKDLDDVLGLSDRLIITTEDAYTYLSSVIKRKNLSSDTKKRRLQILIAAFDHLINEGYLFINPWRGLDKKISNPRKSVEVFTEEERDRIINYFNSFNPHYAGFVDFLFSTGARPGEAIALKWNKVNWSNQTILIDQQIGYGKVVKPPKNDKNRYLKTNARIINILRQQQTISGDNPYNIIFPNNRGEYIAEKNFVRVHWHKCFEATGINYLSLRHTRHTFITMCISMGLNPVVIAGFTGHRVKTLFDHYAGLWQQPSIPEF